MYKNFSKIISILLIAGMGWGGLSSVLGTYAMFSDMETSGNNAFTTGSLEFTVAENWGNSTCDPVTEICPDSNIVDHLALEQTGTLDFKYSVKITEAVSTSTEDVCAKLRVSDGINTILFDQDGKNTPNLRDYESGTILHSAKPALNLTFSLTSDDASLRDQTCKFKYEIKVWQAGLDKDSGGFADEQTISSSITVDPWIIESETPEAPSGQGQLTGELKDQDSIIEDPADEKDPVADPDQTEGNIKIEGDAGDGEITGDGIGGLS
jgi:predicted ribosomally synthesized peptide with SipW-like signal peptide